MKLNEQKFEELAKRKNYINGYDLWLELGGGEDAYDCVKNNSEIGYEIVRAIFNRFGEIETIGVIDFEKETISSLKSKYIQIGDYLYGELDEYNDVSSNISLERTRIEAELLHLFLYDEPILKEYPEWYFENGYYSIKRCQLLDWMDKNQKTWQDVANQLGISIQELKWKTSRYEKLTLMDMVCLIEMIGAVELYKIVQFPSKTIRLKVKRELFEDEG